MKSYETKLDPITGATLKIKLFRQVQNVPELRKQLTSGQLQCCAVKPTLILDPFQLVIATNKALLAEIQERIVTRSVFSEILFTLSISKNVSSSLSQFGIDDNYSDILVAVIRRNGDDTDKVFDAIKGEICDIEHLSEITDLKALKKAYNIDAVEEKNCNLLDTIINKIVTKEC